MGSMSSAFLNERAAQSRSNSTRRSSSPGPEAIRCVAIQLTTVKGFAENVLAVPVCKAAFPSPSHPLFQAFYAAVNEPSVRHWFHCPGQVSEQAPFERTRSVAPELDAELLYTQLMAAPEFSRWVLISVNPDTCHPHDDVPANVAPLQGFIPLPDALLILSDNDSWGVVGSFATTNFFQEPVPRVHVDFFLTKAFSNEGKSGVLFQIATFLLTVSRSNLSPEEQYRLETEAQPLISFGVRSGNVPILRMFQKLFRVCEPHLKAVKVQYSDHQFKTWVSIDDAQLAQVVEVLAHRVVTYTDASSGLECLNLAVDQVQLPRTPSPFDSFVEGAKSVWAVENAPVVKVQPNPHLPTSATNSGRSTPKSSRGTQQAFGSRRSQQQQQQYQQPQPAYSRARSRLSSTSSLSDTSSSGTPESNSPELGAQIVPERQNSDSQLFVTHTATNSSSNAGSARSTPRCGSSRRESGSFTGATGASRRSVLFLEHMSPVHVAVDGAWYPIWWRDDHLQLRISTQQPFKEPGQGGKIMFECRRDIPIYDENGNASVVPLPHGKSSIAIAVPVGSQILEGRPSQRGQGLEILPRVLGQTCLF